MPSFFKKALGVFVDFEDTPASAAQPGATFAPTPTPRIPVAQAPNAAAAGGGLSKEDVDKFEKHFSALMDQANLPGPDYYEFFKMMETLEVHIPDEAARMAAVFASLNIQGLTKEKLLETAAIYAQLVERDNAQFHKALTDKTANEVQGREQSVKDLQSRIQRNTEQIQQLTAQITEYQTQIASLTKEAEREQQRIEINSSAYQIASKAMSAKIAADIQKIQTHIAAS